MCIPSQSMPKYTSENIPKHKVFRSRSERPPDQASDDEESVVVAVAVDTKQKEDEKIAAKVDEKREESTVKDKESTVEDNDPTDAISRLETTAQEYLQEEQEEIKSLVLGENQPDSLMSDMMNRNLTE
jgi:geranylgeranyl pyrophosphate synthase